MSRRLPGVSADLAAAIRAVGAAYDRLPETDRPEIGDEAWKRLERAIDDRCAAGDKDGALEAIRDWHDFAMGRLKEAVR